MEMAGSVAVVTGGSSGIGRAISAELRRAGATVVVADRRSALEAAGALNEAEPAFSEAIGLKVDVSSEQEVATMVERVLGLFGGVDVLVNSAALFAETTRGGFESISVEEWRRVLEVNVIGTALCARAVVGPMRARGGGAILNLASGTVFKGTPFCLHYVASKGAVVALTRSLARELGPDNIRVNALAPGFTLSEGVLARADSFASSIAEAPQSRSLGRAEHPEDVAGAARFLCGPGAGFVTGQTLVVDGGSTLH